MNSTNNIVRNINKSAGIIYLIQPAELIGTNRFKIGCSCQADLNRCARGYKKGSRYMYIIECINPFELESQLKLCFKNKFRLIAGQEYFEGNESEIDNEFITIVLNYKKHNNTNLVTQPTTEISITPALETEISITPTLETNKIYKKELFIRFLEYYLNNVNTIFINNINKTLKHDFYKSYITFSNNDAEELQQRSFYIFCNKLNFITTRQYTIDNRKRYMHLNRELALKYIEKNTK